MRAEHGFRILDYKVDSDAAAPRVCFQFSESLAPKTDFAPFVAVFGAETEPMKLLNVVAAAAAAWLADRLFRPRGSFR